MQKFLVVDHTASCQGERSDPRQSWGKPTHEGR